MKEKTVLTLCLLLFSCSGFCAENPFAVGWTLNPSTPWKLVEAADDAIQGEQHDTRFFRTGGSHARWTLTVEPIWIDPFRVCSFQYRATGEWSQSEPALFVRSGATGPVTPGADNPENPLAVRGDASLLAGEELIPDGKWHDVSLDLSRLLDTHQIDQFVLTIRPEKSAELEIRNLTFENPDFEPIPTNIDLSQIIPPHQSKKWETVELERADSSSTLSQVFSIIPSLQAGRDYFINALPFHFNGAFPTTSLQNEGSIQIHLDGAASEIALLLGCRLYGTDSAWRFAKRTTTREPERLLVNIQYEDGSIFQSFPYKIDEKEFRVDEGISAYVVPCNPSKTLASLTIQEEMSYGQLSLIGLSLHRHGERIAPDPSPVRNPSAKKRESKTQKQTSCDVSLNRETVVLQSGTLTLTLPRTGDFQIVELSHSSYAESLVRAATDRRIFTVELGGREFPSYSFDSSIPDGSIHPDRVSFSHKNGEVPLKLRSELRTEEDGIQFTLQVVNTAPNPQEIRVSVPDLRCLRLSRSLEGDMYCFPLQSAVISSEPADLQQDYSGRFPLQFMDIFSGVRGGMYLLTKDLHVRDKRYAIQKHSVGTDLRVTYGHHMSIRLEPGDTWTSAPTVLGGHTNDWHEALAAYRAWTTEWNKEDDQIREWMQNVWICRRDYPLGGTGYLFDEETNQYTFSELIRESIESFDGIDMIDISGWAYSEERGRVGDYSCSELGGAANLKKETHEAMKHGVRTGLYLEGYLVDERSRIIEDVGNAWQIVDKNGEKKFWPGNREMFMCPAVEEWRNYFSQTYKRVAEETGAHALYVDEYGFADRGKACYNPDHNHRPGQPPLIGEHAMLSAIRTALEESSPHVALYTEEVPCDLTAQLVDAAFCYGMYRANQNTHPTKLNLFRYAFPEFKIIELFIPGIHPRAASEEDTKLAFFHGHATWLKGRAESWYSASFREFVRQTRPIYDRYSDLFTSTHCEPLIPTNVEGVHANRFGAESSARIYTVYNSLPYSIGGSLLDITLASNEELVSLLGRFDTDATLSKKTGTVRVKTLAPHGVGCFLVTRPE